MHSKRFIWLTTLAVIYLGVAQSVLAGTTNAIIPYKAIDDLCQMAGGVDQTKLMFRVFVFSTNEVVRPSDITLTIQSAAKGTVPVQLGTNGQVLNFPHQKELSRENPSIVANQPKGTLKLVTSLQLPMPDALTFRYARLGDGVAEANKLIKTQAGMMPLVAPKAQGVIFIFPKASAGKATVAIPSSSGQKEFFADGKGQVKLKLETSLLSKNPEVHLSEKPEALVPDIE